MGKNHIILKDNDILIFQKDQEFTSVECASIEAKEILNIFMLGNNTIYYFEPSELKKLDLNNLGQKPKLIIFHDNDNNIIEPVISESEPSISAKMKPCLFHIELIKTQSQEEFICAFFKTKTNQLYFSIKKESKEDKLSDLINHSVNFLRNFNDLENLKHLYFKVYTVKLNKEKASFIALFLLCEKIGYFYNINISKLDTVKSLSERILSCFVNDEENNYKILYKFKQSSSHFFCYFEHDPVDQKPVRLLIGTDNLSFHLINLEREYEDIDNENFLFNKNVISSPEYLKSHKPKVLNTENKIEEINESNLVDEYSEIDFAPDNEINNLVINTNNNNNRNSLLEENKIYLTNTFKERAEEIIYLSELVLSFLNKNKKEFGGTNNALNAKLKLDDFVNCFLKQGRIYFFFKNFIYCYNGENNSIQTAYKLKGSETVLDVFFHEEKEQGQKNYHKSYLLSATDIQVFKFEIEDIIEEESEVEKKSDALLIREYLSSNKLVSYYLC